jgi:hypothetical protein
VASSAPSTSSISHEFLSSWCSVAGTQLRSYNMQDLSTSVWALGRLGYIPNSMFLKQVRGVSKPYQPRCW